MTDSADYHAALLERLAEVLDMAALSREQLESWADRSVLFTEENLAENGPQALRHLIPPLGFDADLSPGTVAWPVGYTEDGKLGVVLIWPDYTAAIWRAGTWRYGTWELACHCIAFDAGGYSGDNEDRAGEHPYLQPEAAWPDWLDSDASPQRIRA